MKLSKSPTNKTFWKILTTLKAYDEEKIMKLFKSAHERTHLTHKTHIDTTLNRSLRIEAFDKLIESLKA
jgi:hypothetical protein